jgi:hypothetical protein
VPPKKTLFHEFIYDGPVLIKFSSRIKDVYIGKEKSDSGSNHGVFMSFCMELIILLRMP